MMKSETQPFDIETKVRQDCYNRGYEQGRKNPAEEIVKYIEKLQNQVKEYQDKIEQGTLVELPCKVGDTVYWVWEEFTNGKQKLSIEEWNVEVIHIEENEWAVKGFGKEREDGSRPFFWCHSSRFGIWWFLTREEAEKRLKELQE